MRDNSKVVWKTSTYPKFLLGFSRVWPTWLVWNCPTSISLMSWRTWSSLTCTCDSTGTSLLLVIYYYPALHSDPYTPACPPYARYILTSKSQLRSSPHPPPSAWRGGGRATEYEVDHRQNVDLVRMITDSIILVLKVKQISQSIPNPLSLNTK